MDGEEGNKGQGCSGLYICHEGYAGAITGARNRAWQQALRNWLIVRGQGVNPPLIFAYDRSRSREQKVPRLFKNTFYGWWVVVGCALIVFGVAGGQFSFGVFLKPMTEEFGWSRGTLSLAFAITYVLSGLLRPMAGYLADRYSAKWSALAGVAIMGWMLLMLPLVDNLLQLYLVFGVMSIGVTLGTGPILIKIVAQWFLSRRGLTLGLVGGAGSFGAMFLVPATSAFLVLFTWQQAYLFLGLLLLVMILPIGAWLIRNRPGDMGLEPYGEQPIPSSQAGDEEPGSTAPAFRDSTFGEAIRTPMFQRLTFGYFV